MRHFLFPFCLILILPQLASTSHAQVSDESDLKAEIQLAMISGDRNKCNALFNKAKQKRGNDLGRANSEYEYKKPDSTQINPETLEMVWNLALDQLMTWQLHCPELPTETPAAMLGVYYAQMAENQLVPSAHLLEIGKMLEAQQFNVNRADNPKSLAFGSFSYRKPIENEECNLPQIQERFVLSTCKKYPEFCVQFKEGKFTNRDFLVADQAGFIEKWDATLAYEQAWGTEEMIYSYKNHNDSVFLKSALLSGDWCLKEKPVASHHLTAKLVWALAALYDFTGDSKFKDSMLNLLKINLLPGLLLDENKDRIVDGTEISFDSLAPYSKIPGRLWDAQNANSWNSAIVAYALVNAYASLRDRGDKDAANQLKEKVEATVDNLAFEINHFGTPPVGHGFRDLSFAIFEALWKIDRAENENHPEWQKAARVIWNAGVLRTGGQFTVNLGQLIRWHSATPYKPRFQN